MAFDPGSLSVGLARGFNALPTPEEVQQRDVARLQMSETQRKLRDQGVIRGILAKHGGDMRKASAEIMAVDPELGARFQTLADSADEASIKYRLAKSNMAKSSAQFIGQMLGGAKDEEQWQAGLYALRKAGEDIPEGLEHFDP